MKKLSDVVSLKENIGIDSSNRRLTAIAILITVIIVTTTHLTSGIIINGLNDATRADLSKHVSNLPCGPEYQAVDDGLHEECPGELQCYRGPVLGKYTFKTDRVGANISGARCVTPTYVEHHCGIYEGAPTTDSYPPHVATCGASSLSFTDYIAQLREEDNLYGRFFNTDRNGTERIRSHGLKLAKEDPDASEINLIECSQGEITITNLHYQALPRRITVAITNTGTITLPNISTYTLIDYRQGSDPKVQNRTNLGTLEPGETATGTFTVNTTPERLEAAPHNCRILKEHTETIPGVPE